MPDLLGRSILVERCLRGAESGLGIVLAVTPITLWVAWTPSMLLVAVAVAVISATLLVLLDRRRGAAHEDAGADRQPDGSRPALPDGFVEEIHQIFPLTYHHSRSGPARFRRAMDRLRSLLR
jgi:hypothetical protein